MKIELEASADCADRRRLFPGFILLQNPPPTVAAVCDRRASPLCENLRDLRTISHMNTKLSHIQNWPELARQAKWSVSKLAAHCGVSKRTLRRYFLKTMCQNPKAWLAGQRQKQAIELLRDGSSVKETSSQLGYQNPETFSREFKKLCGKCPYEMALTLPPPRFPRANGR
jgi:AraC-like DNA-binding protein